MQESNALTSHEAQDDNTAGFKSHKTTNFSKRNEDYQDPRDFSPKIEFQQSQDPQEETKLEEPARKNDLMAMCTLDEVLKLFYDQNPIIWYDSKAEFKSEPQLGYLNALRKKRTEVKTPKNFMDLIYQCQSVYYTSCQVILFENHSEELLEAVSKQELVSVIHILDGSTKDYCEKLKKNYPKISGVYEDFKSLSQAIERGPIKKDLPVFNSIKKVGMNKMHYYLRGFLCFDDREQAKQDLITLVKSIYEEKENIKKFEENYDQYDMKTALDWYAKETFFYKVVNNALRIGEADSILYTRLAIKDIEEAIKNQYRTKSRLFNGVLYRAAYITDFEWSRMRQNVDGEIEMFGFLSASKSKKIAEKFYNRDPEKKAFITIVVPAIPELVDGGFAEIEDFSAYKEEKEVLFNVRSRFTILSVWQKKSTDTTKGVRHILLLYGPQEMRRHISYNKPTIRIDVKKKSQLVCQECHSSSSTSNKMDVMFINLGGQNEYICLECMKKSCSDKLSPYLCVFPGVSGNSMEADSVVEIEGMITGYENKIDVPFSGPMCVGCGKGKKLINRFTCARCFHHKKKKKVWCLECLNPTENKCVKRGHQIIWESQPFTFWNQSMSEEEKKSLEYHEQNYQEVESLDQGEIFIKTHNYTKAKQYYEAAQIRAADKQDAQTLQIYERLGGVYHILAEYQKAIEIYSQSLEIRKKLFVESHPSVVVSYNELSMIYCKLARYQQAIGFGKKALEIIIAKFGEDHTSTANSYDVLGNIYKGMKNYPKAREFYSRSEKIRSKIFGEDYPDMAISWINLGDVAKRLGNYGEAIDLCSKAYEQRKRIFGDKDFRVADSLDSLASVYLTLEACEKACLLFLQALAIRKIVYDEFDPKIADSYNNLHLAYFELNNYHQALLFCNLAMKIRKSIYGEQHPLVADLYDNLGEYREPFGEDPTPAYMKSLEIRIAIVGFIHPDVAASYDKINFSLMNRYRYHNLRLDYSVEALNIRKIVFNNEHSWMMDSFDLLKNQNPTQKDQEAMKILSTPVDTTSPVAQNGHIEIAISYVSIGVLHILSRNYKESIKYFLRAIEIKEFLYGADHHLTKEHYYSLMLAYEFLGDEKKMNEISLKLIEIHKAILRELKHETADVLREEEEKSRQARVILEMIEVLRNL